MSGTFEDIDVPPTLVSFAVAMTKASKTISTEFKNAGSKVIFVPVPENKETLMPVWDKLIEMYNAVYALCEDGKVLSASVVKEGGTAASVCKACFGNGFGFKFAKGDYIMLLNNDVELITPDIFQSMLGFCMRPEVGIVGAKLLYNDHTVQHAGVLVGAGGLADHVFKGIHEDDPGYMGRAISSQDVSAVTAACLLVKRSVYELSLIHI